MSGYHERDRSEGKRAVREIFVEKNGKRKRMNIVLIIAWVLALISALAVPPDSAYLSYIDFHTLGLLFCLMAVMAGANRLGIFRQVADKLLTKVKNSHQLELILVFLCFISSMLITNDVALITFVPFAIQVLEMSDRRESIIRVVVLQTSWQILEACLLQSEIRKISICIRNPEWKWENFLH